MITPDPKYLPKAKSKVKTKKIKPVISGSNFPQADYKIDARPMKKKKSPNGDHYVWAK